MFEEFTVEHFDTWAQFHQRSTYSFYARRSRKRKKIDDFTVFFTLLSSAHVKAALKTLMKLTPGVNFINMLTIL